jgi:O-antigen/teichoic acid export membrane protein
LKLARQFSTLLVTNWTVLGIGFLTTVITARVLGPERQGLLALLRASVNLLAVFLGLGLPSAAAFMRKQREHPVGELVAGIAAFYAVATLLVVAAALWGGEVVGRLFLGVAEGVPVARVWLWLTVASLPGILLSSLLGPLLIVDDRIGLLTLWRTSSQVLGLVLTCVLVVFMGWGITGALLANLAVQSASVLATGLYLRGVGPDGKLRVLGKGMRRALQIGLQQHFVSLFANLFKRGETILLAYLLDIRAVGYYSVATGLYDLVVDVPRTLVWPMVGEIADKDTADPEVRAAKGIRMQIPGSIALVFVAGLVLPWLLPLVYGDGFRAAVAPFSYLLPGVVFRTIHLATSAYFLGVGAPGALLVPVMSAAVVSLGLDLLVVPRFGLLGAAATTVLGELAMAALSLRVFLRRSRLTLAEAVVPRKAELLELGSLPGRLLRRQAGDARSHRP